MAIDIENIIESLYIQVMYTNYLPGPALQSTGYSHPVSEEAIVAKTNLHWDQFEKTGRGWLGSFCRTIFCHKTEI